MNPIHVQGWSLSVITLPASGPAAGPTVAFQVVVTLQGGQPVFLRVETVEEFMALSAVLQSPMGQLSFTPNGQILTRSHTGV